MKSGISRMQNGGDIDGIEESNKAVNHVTGVESGVVGLEIKVKGGVDGVKTDGIAENGTNKVVQENVENEVIGVENCTVTSVENGESKKRPGNENNYLEGQNGVNRKTPFRADLSKMQCRTLVEMILLSAVLITVEALLTLPIILFYLPKDPAVNVSTTSS